MYEPNVFTLNLEQMLAGAPLDAAIGVVRVTIHTARGIKGAKIGGGTPDPYVKLNINNRETLGKTHHRKNTYVTVGILSFVRSTLTYVSSRSNPTWNETILLLVNTLQESLILDLMDYNDHRADSHLGFAQFELGKLLNDSTQEGISSTIFKDGKDRGQLQYDVSYYPVLQPTVIDGKEDLPETSMSFYTSCCGVLNADFVTQVLVLYA